MKTQTKHIIARELNSRSPEKMMLLGASSSTMTSRVQAHKCEACTPHHDNDSQYTIDTPYLVTLDPSGDVSVDGASGFTAPLLRENLEANLVMSKGLRSAQRVQVPGI